MARLVAQLNDLDIETLTAREVSDLAKSVKMDPGKIERLERSAWPNKEPWALDFVEQALTGHSHVAGVWRLVEKKDIDEAEAAVERARQALEQSANYLAGLRSSFTSAEETREFRRDPEGFKKRRQEQLARATNFAMPPGKQPVGVSRSIGEDSPPSVSGFRRSLPGQQLGQDQKSAAGGPGSPVLSDPDQKATPKTKPEDDDNPAVGLVVGETVHQKPKGGNPGHLPALPDGQFYGEQCGGRFWPIWRTEVEPGTQEEESTVEYRLIGYEEDLPGKSPAKASSDVAAWAASPIADSVDRGRALEEIARISGEINQAAKEAGAPDLPENQTYGSPIPHGIDGKRWPILESITVDGKIVDYKLAGYFPPTDQPAHPGLPANVAAGNAGQ